MSQTAVVFWAGLAATVLVGLVHLVTAVEKVGTPEFDAGLRKLGNAVFPLAVLASAVGGVWWLLSDNNGSSDGGSPTSTSESPTTSVSVPNTPPTLDEASEFIKDYLFRADDESHESEAWAMLSENDQNDYPYGFDQFLAFWRDEVEHVEMGDVVLGDGPQPDDGASIRVAATLTYVYYVDEDGGGAVYRQAEDVEFIIRRTSEGLIIDDYIP